MLVKEYFFYHDKYVKQYGQKTIVLMQVGSFFETYSNENKGPPLKNIQNLLNIIITKKDKKKPLADDNPYMLGFPSVAIDKYINILIDNNYTVVLIEQVTPKPNPKRKVTNIFSPSTYIENNKYDTNYLLSLYIENVNCKNKTNITCIGISIIDLTTGYNIVHESYSTFDDNNYSFDDVTRFINSHEPKEIILYKKDDYNNLNDDKIIEYLGLENYNYHFIRKLEKKIFTLDYQKSFLEKIYDNSSMLNIFEFLDIEKYIYAIKSFIIMLDFAYKHNENIINNIRKPEIFNNNKHLILGNNAIEQLNVLNSNNKSNSSNTFNSLFDVVNNTSTTMGKRYLKNILSAPLLNKKKLKTRYDFIESLIVDNHYVNIEKKLNSILDVERLHRRLLLSKLHPHELYNLYISYHNTIEICNYFKNNNIKSKIAKFNKVKNKTKEIYDEILKFFNVDELKKYNINDIKTSFFNKNINQDIDNLQKNIDNDFEFINLTCFCLSKLVDDSGKSVFVRENENKITIKYNDRDSYFITTTKLRAKSIKKNIKNVKNIKISKNFTLNTNELSFSDMKGSSTKIAFPKLSDISKNIYNNQQQLSILMNEKYLESLHYFCGKFYSYFNAINSFISLVDYFKSCAKTAVKYNYTRPTFIKNNSNNEKSIDNGAIVCSNLRHPIIERINTETEYIPHSFNLGNNPNLSSDINTNGMLIYGINSSGKCFHPNTKIMLYNGSIKKAKYVTKNDILMGDDSTPRNITEIHKGKDQLFKVNLFDNKNFICNGNHILCLLKKSNHHFFYDSKIKKYTIEYIDKYHCYSKKYFANLIDSFNFIDHIKSFNNNLLEISTIDYLKKSSFWKSNYKLYRRGVYFNDNNFKPSLIVNYVINNKNDFMNIDKCEFINNKKYLQGSRFYRFTLIHFLFDYCNFSNLDSTYFYISSQKYICNIVSYIISSLGYYNYSYMINNNYFVNVDEKFFNEYYLIKLYHDENYKSNNLVSDINNSNKFYTISFDICPYNYGNYIGFTIDGNQRFLLDDFTVTHNSSFMKAIGLSVIMAQSGMFVPASSFSFSPYDSLFARISGNDDLFRGLSSFSLEMTELRAILKRTGPKTLVIGDEVCRGTEYVSANSIVASTLIKLAKSNSSFIFATHLHDIPKMKQIKELDNIKSFHLTVDYDPNSDTLVFDRKLKPGQGDSVYGLTVAKYIIHDSDFIKSAQEIKNDIIHNSNSILSTNTSKYNNRLFIHKCSICGITYNDPSKFDTHHINEQKNCSNNFVNDKPHLHKNSKANLVVLCKKCHDKIHHSSNLFIDKYIHTSNGVHLNYYTKNISNTDNKKYKNHIELIKKLYKKSSNLKDLKFNLFKLHNLDISISTLSKIINDTY